MSDTTYIAKRYCRVGFNVGEIAHQGEILCVMGTSLWFTRFGANFYRL